MHRSSLHLINETHFYQSGDVTIHKSAAIAPGVLLQADPGSQLVIAEGVCIGAGAVLHAQHGTLEVGAGATLGSGVLVVGNVRIGANACIGSMATIYNCAIVPEQVVPPGALIAEAGIVQGSPEPSDLSVETDAKTDTKESDVKSTSESSADHSSPVLTAQVYGLAAFERLMVSLFPQKQSLSAVPQDPPSVADESTQ